MDKNVQKEYTKQLKSFDRAELYEDAIAHLKVVDKDFENKMNKKKMHKYSSFHLSYFILRKLFNLEYQEPDHYFLKVWYLEKSKHPPINFLGAVLDTRLKKIIFTKPFLNFLKSKQLEITDFSNLARSMLFCLKIKEFLGFYFDERFYLRSLITISPLGYFCSHLDYEDFNIFRKRYKDIHENTAWHIHNDYFSLKSINGKRGLAGTKSFLNYPSLASHDFFVSNLLELHNPTSRKHKLNEVKRAQKISHKVAYIIFKNNHFSSEFLNSFEVIFKICSSKIWFLPNITKCSAVDIETINKNISYLRKFWGVNVNPANITLRLFNELKDRKLLKSGEINNFGKEVLALMKPFPSNTIGINKPVNFGDYSVSQVKSVNELKAIGKEFRNCLRDTYSYRDKGLSGQSIFLVFRGKDSKFVAEVNSSGYSNGTVLEAKKPENRNLSGRESKALHDFIIGFLLLVPQDFILSFFLYLQKICKNKRIEESTKFIVENLDVLQFLLKKLDMNSPDVYRDLDFNYFNRNEKDFLDKVGLIKKGVIKAHSMQAA